MVLNNHGEKFQEMKDIQTFLQGFLTSDEEGFKEQFNDEMNSIMCGDFHEGNIYFTMTGKLSLKCFPVNWTTGSLCQHK